MTDPLLSNDTLTAFLNGPYILLVTQAVKDIQKKMTAKHPRVAEFLRRYFIPTIPVFAGLTYAHFAQISLTAGFEGGLATSGAFRTYAVMVHGK